MAVSHTPRGTYYNLVRKMERPYPDFDLKTEIQAIYEEHEGLGRYCYRRIRDELANRGQKVNYKKVQCSNYFIGKKFECVEHFKIELEKS